MLMRAATVVQVLQDLFYVLLQLLVVAAIILSFTVCFIARFITAQCTLVQARSWDRMSSVRLSVCDVGDL